MSCDKCKSIAHSHDGNPFVPLNGSCNDLTYECPDCHAYWWQFNAHFHLWRAVPSETFLAVKNGKDVAIDIGSGRVLGPAGSFIGF
ncbi:MAG: hypothetical protein WAW00_01925 [Candidatus Moraniibacteriota bacterium]